MTIRELKKIDRRISILKSKVARLKSNAVKSTGAITGMPTAPSDNDKIGIAVAAIADIQDEIDQLVKYRNHELDRLSHEIMEANCIYLHIVKGYSWRYVAVKVYGRPDAEESVKKRCYRFEW